MYLIKYAIVFAIILLYCFRSLAQPNSTDYDLLWKKVEELSTKKGLTQSALVEVKKIYALAKKENKEAQAIKALLYQSNLNAMTDENASANNIKELEKEINAAREPSASLLKSILAEKYWNYFQQHRYQLYNRTQTGGSVSEDIATWSTGDLHHRIGSLYLASIQNKKVLQAAKLEPYDPIIIKGNARSLRPTLYDLLAHRALSYFSNDERDINKPAYAFQLNDIAYFAAAPTFSRMKIVTPDTSSLHHKALLIYQDLLLFHANDAKPDALIDADIHRLQFVSRFAVMENASVAYADALKAITARYPDQPAAAQAWYLLAQWHADKAATYSPLTDTIDRYEYLEAKKICDQLMKQKGESEGKTNALGLLRTIQHKELNLQTEKVNMPGVPFRTLVHFRNFSKLYLRILPLTDEWRTQFRNRYDDRFWDELTRMKPLRSWEQSLPATNDHQKHSTEIKVDALPLGSYILVASVNDNFASVGTTMAVHYFHVSKISYINRGVDYFVLDRETGNPLSGANVQVWMNKYSYQTRKSELSKDRKYVTDNHGFFAMQINKDNQSEARLEINHANDRLFLEDYQYSYYRGEDGASTDKMTKEVFEKINARVFFFTDRSIYRPGQTIYFKGIALTKAFEDRNNKILENFKTTVRLFNANGEASDSLSLTTNEYGSYSGSFTLPANLLNGEFRLEDRNLEGAVSFSVEEYKRPRFYLAFDTLKGSYKVNDSITIRGSAKAYAGNNINDAMVKFRVVRQPRFIYPWLFWRKGIPRGSSMEITNGVVSTGASGEFTFTFKAIPDPTVSKEFNPVFDYRVFVDITDINGETRSNELTVPVSYKALQVKVNLTPGGMIAIDSFHSVPISTQNLNGKFDPALVNISIARLDQPDRLIRKRYWQQPDQYVLGKQEFLNIFPYDEYENETDYHSWNRKETVYSASDSTREGSDHQLGKTKFTEGWYVIEVTTRDKYGEEVKDVAYFALYDDKSKQHSLMQYAWIIQKNKVIEPGEASTITVGTAASDLYVIQEIDKKIITAIPFNTVPGSQKPSSSEYNYIRLNREKQSFSFNATEQDRGGYGVNYFFVKNNRFYLLASQVNVPWTNKELDITYETFRDKSLPGSEEKWKVKISGYRKEKLAAEMLASMYDASLDQFRAHSWNAPPIWQTYTNSYPWTGFTNFNAVNSEEKYVNQPGSYRYPKEYDRISMPYGNIAIRGRVSNIKEMSSDLSLQEAVVVGYGSSKKVAADMSESMMISPRPAVPAASPTQASNNQDVVIRKNFNETAFFYPDLKTDAAGNIEFSFTLPEALTRWKFQALAYTKEAAFGQSSKEIITQKQLMVQPNAPRFLREGDRMELSTKIVNLSTKEITGTIQLQLFDAVTMQPVDGWFKNMMANQYFTAEAGKSVSANFPVEIPYLNHSAIVYRFVARGPAGDTLSKSAPGATISDGEEGILPVLTNSMLVTESIPLPLRNTQTKTFRFDKLLQSGGSETLQHHAVTVEYSANPSWYVVQALPYLSEAKFESSDQEFNRFYANALATKISRSSPAIQEMFNKWKNAVPGSADSNSLLSNLQKNQELKSLLIQETPWVLDAKSETEQKKNIALLFDPSRMERELGSSLQMLQQYQTSNGGFTWFKGGRDDRYFTQYILAGLGRLKAMDALPPSSLAAIDQIVEPAMNYLDKRLKEDYSALMKNKFDRRVNQAGYLQVQYFYVLSFFKEYASKNQQASPAITFYRKQVQEHWLVHSRYMQGMIAIYLYRTGDQSTARKIVESLKQNATINEEMGMYWKDNRGGYYWHQAPVETQSLLIETFSEISNNIQLVNDLKTWLLKQKQTRNWKSSKATADACYALLLRGTNWLKEEPVVNIKLGDKLVNSKQENPESGTGYLKKSFTGPFINPSMGEISVTINSTPLPGAQGQTSNPASTGPSWGAVYWQYFEKLDKITPSATPLSLVKKIYVEKNTDRGPVLQPVKDGDKLEVGDKIKVRIELRSDRDMEYVHMKDMRASAMEPVNVISRYKWQGGLGYYESTGDAGTNFFFSFLPKGTYVFEYPLFVSHSGNYSNGVTSIQCLYAPEFSSHSEGIRINVD